MSAYDSISIFLYWGLVIVWAIVVLIYLTRYDQPKAQEPRINLFLRLLLIAGFAILAVDSLYFSSLFTSSEEPSAVVYFLQTILGSQYTVVPKIGLLIFSILLLYLVWRRGMKEMEAETQNMKKLAALNSIATTVSQSLDLNEILRTALDKVQEVMGMDASEIMLLEDGKHYIAARNGLPPSLGDAAQELARIVMVSGRPQMIDNLTTEPLLAASDASPNGFQSLVSVPLRAKDKQLGIMNIYARRQTSLDPEDLDLLTSIGHQMGVAIENAQLFTDLDQAYRDLARTQAELVRSAKLSAVGELAAGIAHEIANPLAAIIVDTASLLEDIDPSNMAYESAAAIQRASLRARKVIRNLLDFSRQEEFEFQPGDINGTINTALSLIAHQIMASHIRLSKDLAPNLPLVMVSPHHLEEVWINLLTNARDAIPTDRDGEIQISTRLAEAASPAVAAPAYVETEGAVQPVQVIISDNGSGIPPDRLEKIFEPFYTTKGPGKGTGLGLFICYEIIKRHNGTIAVDSQPGEGTTFTITLPAWEGQADELADALV